MKKDEAGISLIEVLISMTIFAIFTLGIVYIFLGSASRVTEDSQISDLQMAGSSVLSLLVASQSPQNWNGAVFNANGASGVPAGESTLDAGTLDDVQKELASASNAAEINLSVVPDNGVTCPCSVSERYSWKGGKWATLSAIRY